MNDSGTLDDLYLTWLYSQIADVQETNPRRTYWELAKQLYSTPFIWLVRNDDNREADGKALREHFIEECDIQDIEINWLQLECSMFEMLIALAGRSSFESHGTVGDWFWKFLENLEITYSDDQYNAVVQRDVEAVLERVNNRTYKPNGEGGIFPLKHAQNDQRDVELWYQLSAYLLEGDYIDHGP